MERRAFPRDELRRHHHGGSADLGRGFFANVGDTLRQGVELGMRYTDKKRMVYANYALVDATIQIERAVCPSPNNPHAPFRANGAARTAHRCATLRASKGDRLPGIPEHRFKTGLEYWFTPQMKFGADRRRCQQSDLL